MGNHLTDKMKMMQKFDFQENVYFFFQLQINQWVACSFQDTQVCFNCIFQTVEARF